MAAFEQAMNDGADGVELDLRLCRDGEVVVFHDADLKRLSTQRDRISSLRLHELKQVRLNDGQSIPTLVECLELLETRQALVNLELKADGNNGRKLAEAVLDICHKRKATHQTRFLFSSFALSIVRYLKKHSPIKSAYLIDDAYWGKLRMQGVARLCNIDALHPKHNLIDSTSAALLQSRGTLLNVWTVDHPQDLRRCDEAGVDAIITNNITKARETLEK
ncbi:MAG: hypothetical protein IPJ88_17030 [Myxococcales bacterium]|nr:MAG: hypothetical protein IPJ88_17030 [Myxococcales bacterium]